MFGFDLTALDIGVGIFIFIMVLTWDKDKKNATEDNKTSARFFSWKQQSRTLGVDRKRAEEIRNELMRRGVEKPPVMPEDNASAATVFAELMVMLENTPYTPRDTIKVGLDKSVNALHPPIWPRAPDPDDDSI